MTYDALVEATGLSKPLVLYGLQGERALTVEAFVLLCNALRCSASRLLNQAEHDARIASTDDRLLDAATERLASIPTQGDLSQAADHPSTDPDFTGGGL